MNNDLICSQCSRKLDRDDESIRLGNGDYLCRYCAECYSDAFPEDEEQPEEKAPPEAAVREGMRDEFRRQIQRKRAELEALGMKREKLRREIELLEEMLGNI